jgi:septal ring factor EnvC (AmiA/AmiB activator)
MITDFIPLEDYRELKRFIDDLENKDIIEDRILSWLIAIDKIKTTSGGGWFIEDPIVEDLESDLEQANERIEDLEDELKEEKQNHRKTADELERAEQELAQLNKQLDLLGE